MRRFTLFRWAASLTLAIAMATSAAFAQEADTLSISGTFRADLRSGTVGDDLLQVYANGDDHTWTLNLHGVSYSHDFYNWFDSSSNYVYWGYITSVHATSIDIQFFGPDADILNAVVSHQLASDGAFFEMSNNWAWDSLFDGEYYSASWRLFLPFDDPREGYVYCFGDEAWAQFPEDENGYPLVRPQVLFADESRISDSRPGNSGYLYSYADLVALGSSEPPVLPPPPPPTLPSLSIADASVVEGNKGASSLNVRVNLSATSDEVVIVDFATANGTAVEDSDYFATSGTLTFQPGDTSRTISVSIKGDRKREPNEAFSVQLSNAAGATIADGVATATILNDD